MPDTKAKHQLKQKRPWEERVDWSLSVLRAELLIDRVSTASKERMK